MGFIERMNSLLDYKIEIDLDKRVSRNKAVFFLILLAIVLTLAGYYIGDRWFWVNYQTYYEYRIDSLKELLKEHPDSNNIRAELAMTNYLNGETAKSIGMLRDILSKEPGNAAATLYLGLILSEQKEHRESIGLLTDYIKKNRGLETRLAFLYLGRDYLAVGKYDLALKYLKYAAVRDPGNPVVYYYLGQTYEKRQDKKNAIVSYEKALKINNGYAEADSALKSLVGGSGLD